MKLGFFNTSMIQRLSDNALEEIRIEWRKRAWASPNTKQWWLFFDIRGIIYIDWVPEGQTVNQVYYKNVLNTFRERVRRRRPDMWKNASWILHQDNAPAHNAICEEVLGEKRHSSDGTSTVLAGPSTVRLFSLPKSQVCAQRNQVRVRGCSESKSDATLEQHNTRGPTALLPTVENSHGAV